MNEPSPIRNRMALAAGVYAVLLVVVYLLIYSYEPFGDWNRLVADSLTILAALSCAVTLTVIVTYYQPGEPPRQVWIYFALAVWAWTFGEILWAGYNQVLGEVPDLSWGDAFYFIGYLFFTLALTSQYRLVLFLPGRKIFWYTAGIWVAMVLATWLVMALSKSEAFAIEFLGYFYPVGDLAVGIAALILVMTFRGGTLARPWLSLLAFVISDSLYVWATAHDVYTWGDAGGEATQLWITLVVDTIYLIAYMIMFWGAFQHFLTLRFGAVVPERDTKPIRAPQEP